VVMGLESRYRELFSSSIRTAGLNLFEKNAVSIYDGGMDKFSCEVTSGNDLYDVNFVCIDKAVEMMCDCSSVKNRACSHQWAAILTAEKFDVFKDGARRGVRLAGTAASLESLPTPDTKIALKSISVNLRDVLVEREVLFVLNGDNSLHNEFIALDLFWRPVGQKGPIKVMNPFGSLNGLSKFDKLVLSNLSQYNISTQGNLSLQANKEVSNILMRILENKLLYSKMTSSQRQFKKVNIVQEGFIKLSAELDIESQYSFQVSFSDHSLEELICVTEYFFISERGIYTTEKSNLQPLIDYITLKGYSVPAWDLENFMESVILPSGIDMSSLPGRMRCEKIVGEPRGNLFIKTAMFKFRDKEQLHAELSFNYGAKRVLDDNSQEEVLDFYNSQILKRNKVKEIECRELLKEFGFRFNESSHKEEYGWKLSPVKLPETVEKLLRHDWIVVAEGKTYTAPKTFELKISSGTDWFDLSGEVQYDNEVVPIAGLVQASKEGSHFVQLGDGSFGVLPEEWLKYYTVLTQLGKLVEGNLRFRKSQALIIEKLLSEKLEKDPGFQALAKSLKDVSTLTPASCHPSFQGSLRQYQKEGLAWLQFLARAGFGGILADDMGLGKTIQILALLQSVKHKAKSPVLLVVPRSLIFNWQSEIIKFTPDLSCLVYTGSSRRAKTASFPNVDIVITTYGTIRQDVESLVNYQFSYCILDEAQAIKNRDSSTAKALRLINADNRISMSGTPIENSLSDLISQFEFLNPGMTAEGKLADLLLGDDKLTKKTIKNLKEAFKPFILRRTKKQVAKDLPEKSEQVIYCEMESTQRDIYDKMLAWYRQELSKEVTPEAGEKKGMDFLGALTRLRQLSCHPGLVNEEWRDAESVKVTVLIDRLKILISEGHRALVFSQFTSFLALIQEKVTQEKWDFCYLDGKTKDRQGEVEKFQNNADIPLFLISLKAGGVGLNLTGADYVFLMDPWWNPAIENQAVDRAYRIGQTKQVMACRLVCRGTVEEKVLLMQKSKQQLADSLIEEDEGKMSKLSMDDFCNLIF
jgi:superfamily II DNA or RNA helicase